MTKNSDPKELSLAILPLPFSERKDQVFQPSSYALRKTALPRRKINDCYLLASNDWVSGQSQEFVILGFFLSPISLKTQSSVLWNGEQNDTCTVVEGKGFWSLSLLGSKQWVPSSFRDLKMNRQTGTWWQELCTPSYKVPRLSSMWPPMGLTEVF